MSVTKAGLAGTDRRDRRGRTMGRGLSESRGSVREYTRKEQRTDVLSSVREYARKERRTNVLSVS